MLSNSLDKKFLLKNNHRTWIIGSTWLITLFSMAPLAQFFIQQFLPCRTLDLAPPLLLIEVLTISIVTMIGWVARAMIGTINKRQVKEMIVDFDSTGSYLTWTRLWVTSLGNYFWSVKWAVFTLILGHGVCAVSCSLYCSTTTSYTAGCPWRPLSVSTINWNSTSAIVRVTSLKNKVNIVLCIQLKYDSAPFRGFYLATLNL